MTLDDQAQNEALQSDVRIDNVVEAYARSEAFDVQIHHSRWLEKGTGTYAPSTCFVELVLGRSLVQATYDRGGRYQPVGDVVFIPENTPLYCEFGHGTQRSVSCLFDAERLTREASPNWRWPGIDLADTLAIGNDYVRAGLRRVAEELLSPGFASAASVEISLMFVAFELGRILGGTPSVDVSDTGRLSNRQLARMREMAYDLTGEEPSIGEYAAALSMAPRQLSSAFRATTGETLRDFLARARIELAKQMLGERRLMIKQVAYRSGFGSSSAFVAAFRKATGVTPTEHRQRLGIDPLH